MTVETRSVVPFVHVADVARSIEFYNVLGCQVKAQHPEDGPPEWVSLECGRALLMLASAGEPVVASQQAVLFYLYCDDVAAMHAHVVAARALRRAPSPAPSTARAASSAWTTRMATR